MLLQNYNKEVQDVIKAWASKCLGKGIRWRMEEVKAEL